LERAQPLVAVTARLGLAKAALELGDLLVARIRRRRYRPTLLRRLAELARVTLSPPARQMLRIQPLTPQ
jgi:hypothetical protein